MKDDNNSTQWGTDTQISLPKPSQFEILVNMGAHGITMYGLNHNLTMADIEQYTPNFVGRPNIGNA